MSNTNRTRYTKTSLIALLGVTMIPMAWSDQLIPPAKAPIRRTFGSVPEFPVLAVRYHVMGKVIARLHVDQDGHVSKTDIVESPADFLSAVVVDATQDWQFTSPSNGEAVLTVTFPFTRTVDDYPYDKNIRPQKRMPKTASDVAVPLINGWAEFKLLIDRDGKPAKDPETRTFDHLVLKSSSDEFKKMVPAIIAAMNFERTTENSSTNAAKAMNRFKVTVIDEAVQIEQFSGD